MWAEISLPTFSCEGRIILDLFTAKRSSSTTLNLDVFPSATARFLNFNRYLCSKNECSTTARRSLVLLKNREQPT